jgi:CubicO group peptidase (beta-lactamase class C family)
MTATLCAILVEEGKLKWDSTIAQVFPEIVSKIDKPYCSVTLEQLLTHHSGLPEDRKPAPILQTIRKFQGSLPEARRVWMIDSLSKPPTAPPGTKHQYSNAGYIIAGAMCEKVTGFAWEDLMTQRIFKPLGMETAGFGPPGKPGKVDQPLGHSPTNIPLEPGDTSDNPAALGPAGTVHCSLPDWAKFISAQLARNKLVGADSYTKLQTPVTDPQVPYAMGWLVIDRDWADGEALTHSGSNGFWYATAWASPRKQMAVLIATNQAGVTAPKACDDVATIMINRFIEPAKSANP